AAEEKARATYENLMEMTNDEDVLAPLSFLRQREVVHFNRFKELQTIYKKERLI
ncbi:MAG: manganese catalase family protein, partial [Bacilli bacterium]